VSFKLPNPSETVWDARYSKATAKVGSLVKLVNCKAVDKNNTFLRKMYNGLALVLANEPITLASDGHYDAFNLVVLWDLTTGEKIRVYYFEGVTFDPVEDCYTGSIPPQSQI
jgi:hypothetical protein